MYHDNLPNLSQCCTVDNTTTICAYILCTVTTPCRLERKTAIETGGVVGLTPMLSGMVTLTLLLSWMVMEAGLDLP